jgi:hypothetical protein
MTFQRLRFLQHNQATNSYVCVSDVEYRYSYIDTFIWIIGMEKKYISAAAAGVGNAPSWPSNNNNNNNNEYRLSFTEWYTTCKVEPIKKEVAASIMMCHLVHLLLQVVADGIASCHGSDGYLYLLFRFAMSRMV